MKPLQALQLVRKIVNLIMPNGGRYAKVAEDIARLLHEAGINEN